MGFYVCNKHMNLNKCIFYVFNYIYMIKWWCLMFNLPRLVYVSYHNDPASVEFPFCKLQIPLADPIANLFVIS